MGEWRVIPVAANRMPPPAPHPPRRPGAGDSLARVLEHVTVVIDMDSSDIRAMPCAI